MAFSGKAVCELDDLLPRCAGDQSFQERFRFIADKSTQAQYFVFDGEFVEPRPVVLYNLRFAF